MDSLQYLITNNTKNSQAFYYSNINIDISVEQNISEVCKAEDEERYFYVVIEKIWGILKVFSYTPLSNDKVVREGAKKDWKECNWWSKRVQATRSQKWVSRTPGTLKENCFFFVKKRPFIFWKKLAEDRCNQ